MTQSKFPRATPTVELGLSVRSFNALMRAGLTTMGAIEDYGIESLLGLRNFGENSYNEVLDKLHIEKKHTKATNKLQSQQQTSAKPRSQEELPLFLNLKEVPDVLSIGRSSVRALLHYEGFPFVRIGGKSGDYRIPRDKLFTWLETKIQTMSADVSADSTNKMEDAE